MWPKLASNLSQVLWLPQIMISATCYESVSLKIYFDVGVCTWVQVSEKGSDNLALEIQMILSHLMSGLGTELRSSPRALSGWVLTPAPCRLSLVGETGQALWKGRICWLCVTVHAFKPYTWEAKGGGSQVWKLEVSLGYIQKTCLKSGGDTKETEKLGGIDKDILVGRNLWAESGNMVCPRCPGTEQWVLKAASGSCCKELGGNLGILVGKKPSHQPCATKQPPTPTPDLSLLLWPWPSQIALFPESGPVHCHHLEEARRL